MNTEEESNALCAEVSYLLSKLSIDRSDDFHKWREICNILCNMKDYMLFNEFTIFSKRCPTKYSNSACRNLWDILEDTRDDMEGVKQLRILAQHDNPNEKIKEMEEFNLSPGFYSDIETLVVNTMIFLDELPLGEQLAYHNLVKDLIKPLYTYDPSLN
jgi:hypothetical protein